MEPLLWGFDLLLILILSIASVVTYFVVRLYTKRKQLSSFRLSLVVSIVTSVVLVVLFLISASIFQVVFRNVKSMNQAWSMEAWKVFVIFVCSVWMTTFVFMASTASDSAVTLVNDYSAAGIRRTITAMLATTIAFALLSNILVNLTCPSLKSMPPPVQTKCSLVSQLEQKAKALVTGQPQPTAPTAPTPEAPSSDAVLSGVAPVPPAAGLLPGLPGLPSAVPGLSGPPAVPPAGLAARLAARLPTRMIDGLKRASSMPMESVK